MHKIIAAYLNGFTKDNLIEALDEPKIFERFVNFSIISNFFPDHFEIEDVTTHKDEYSIDGASILNR